MSTQTQRPHIWRICGLLTLSFALLACGESNNDNTQQTPTPDASTDTAPMASNDTNTADTETAEDAPSDLPEADTETDAEADVVEAVPTPDYLEDAELPEASEGDFTVLTYNVAGLPQGISDSNPEVFIPQISPLLNTYDLVLAQEDFWFHTELAQDAQHPYVSFPRPIMGNIGDGLNRFSIFPFGSYERHAWGFCHGQFECASDCLATKGFSYAVMGLANGVEVDVYNLHVEAGGCAEDLIAREKGIRALIAFAKERSVDRPIIMAGDFNLHVVRDAEDGVLFAELLEELDLRDACWEVDCSEERIDRLLVRNSATLNLAVRSWEVPPQFIDENGIDLSDHKPVAVELHWDTP